MKTNFPRIIALLALYALAIPAIAAPPVPEPIPGHVKATLMADVSNIRAGGSFTIGVHLEIERGFHVYWTNPGDAGLPTTVTFKAPEGFTVVPDAFPIPRRIQQTNKEVIYGYETPVVFTARVTAPAELRIGDRVTFEASADWLVCGKESCMPGKSGPLSLAMKVEGHTGPKNVDAFQRYGSTVAGPKDRLPDLAGIQTTLDAATHTATLTIHWKTPCTGIQIFPGADDAVKLGKVTILKTENDLTPITFKFEILPDQKPATNRLPILISFRDSDGHQRGIQSGIPVK